MLTDEERKEHQREYWRQWCKDHPEKIHAYSAKYAKSHPEKGREKQARYAAAHPEKVHLRATKWKRANPERVVRNRKAYYEANRQKAIEDAITWGQNNPEKARERHAKWYKANPKVFALNRAKRRALKYANTPIDEMLTSTEWLAILADANGHCHYCGKEAKLTLDHVIPLSKGGKHSKNNVIPACLHCNCSKKDKTLEEWNVKRLKQPTN